MISRALKHDSLCHHGPFAEVLGMGQRFFDSLDGPSGIAQIDPQLGLLAEGLGAPLMVGPRHVPQGLVVQFQAFAITSLKSSHPRQLVQRAALTPLIAGRSKGTPRL